MYLCALDEDVCGSGVITKIFFFLPEHYMEVIGQLHFLVILTQRKEPPVANKQECVWAPVLVRAL